MHLPFLSFRQPPPWLTPCPLAVSRSCFGIRLALADGSGLPFSLHPPLAALESQTPRGRSSAVGGSLSVTSVPPPLQNVCARRTHLNILSQSDKIFHTRKARISPPQSGDFTRRLCRRISPAKPKPVPQTASRKPRRFSRENLFGKRPLILPRSRLSAAFAAPRGDSSPFRRSGVRAPLSAPLCKGSCRAEGATEGLYRRQGVAFTPRRHSEVKSRKIK